MIKILLLQFLVFSFLALPTYSQVTKTEVANEYLNNLREELNLPGISAAIAIQNTVIFQTGSGFSNIEYEIEATPKSVYPIASVSKVLTTTAMMALVAEGVLDLDTPISQYLDYQNSNEITLRQLSSHTAGIRHYNYREDIGAYQGIDDLSNSLQIYINDPLLFPPGTGYNYTSYGINLIGSVMESATGKSFDEIIAEELLKPLNLNNTFTRFPDNGVTTYSSDLEPIELPNLRFNVAGGGMYSNVVDLARFGQAVLKYQLNDSDWSETVFTNQTLADGTEVEYGIGWVINRLGNDNKVYSHGGHMDGVHSLLLLIPEMNASIAMISNRGSRFGVEEGLELFCSFASENTDCVELHEDESMDRELIMRHFTNISETHNNFLTWFNDGDASSIQNIISDGFSSTLWRNKADLVNAVNINNQTLDAFDVDVSLRGIEEGDQANVSVFQFSSSTDRTDYYLELTLNNGKWWITGFHTL